MTLDKKVNRAGVIGRFKPLHYGGALMLEELCKSAEHVVIGVGSANMHDARNPFTAEESRDMIDAYLSTQFSNYEIVLVDQFGHIPEYHDGKRWTEEVLKLYGPLDVFVSGNDYVRQLLEPHYNIVESYSIIPEEKRIRLSATDVRIEMARGESWRELLPKEVEAYLDKNHLVDRFRKEYGLYTLGQLVRGDHSPHSALEEKMAIVGVK